jgi:hypothetical protein
VAAQSARRRHPVWERHSAPGCSVAVRYAGVAYPRLRLRGEPKAQFESAALLRRAGCPIPEVASVRVPTSAGAGRVRTVRPLMPAAIVSCPQAAAVPETARSLMPAAIASCPQAASAKAQVAEILDRAHASAEAVRGQPAKTLARPFQAAQASALVRLALPVASARLAPQDAAVAVAAVAARVAAAAPQQAGEARAGAAVLRPEAAARVAAAALQLAEEVPGAQAGLPSGLPSVLPSAWACRRGRHRWLPAPQPAARFARAMKRLRNASP